MQFNLGGGNAQQISNIANMSVLKSYFSLLYWFYRYGFDFNDYVTFRFWQKTSQQRKEYISLRRNDTLRFKLSTPEVYRVFLDKAKFNETFHKYIKREWMRTRGATSDEIRSFCLRQNGAIAKPLNDYGGKGVTKIQGGNITDRQVNDLIHGDFILEQCIVNSASIQRLAPGSLNTLRIVTLIDKNKQLHILATLLRMGNGLALTDNYHDGGMACPIDHSGRLTKTAYSMGVKEYEVHPYSKIKFEGYKVEGYEKCMDMVKDLSRIMPEARYVGWDFAITESGIDLLEANIPPGEDITQLATGRGIYQDILNII